MNNLEEKVFPKVESTVLIHPDNNVTHTDLQTNSQSTNSSEIDIHDHKNFHLSAVPQTKVSEVTLQGSSPPGSAGKRRKLPPRNSHLNDKAKVFCPIPERKGHCFIGRRWDFSHKSIPLNKCVLN